MQADELRGIQGEGCRQMNYGAFSLFLTKGGGFSSHFVLI